MGDLFGMMLIFASVAAWFTHVVVCIINELWVFLLAGAIFFPIGIIHGVMIWLGVA